MRRTLRPVAGVTDVTGHGVTGDGTTNDRAAIQAVINTYAGTRTIRFPAGRYRIGAGGPGANRIVLPSGTHILCDPGAVFEINQVDNQSGTAIFYAAGTDGTKANMPSDTAAGAQTITLPAGQGANFAWGDLVGIEAQTSAGTYDSGPFYVREIRKVIGVTGDVLRLDIPLEYAYAAAATAQFWKITPVKNIVLSGMVFESGPNLTPGTEGCYALQMRSALNCRIENMELHHMVGGVRLFDCYDADVDGIDGDSLPAYGDNVEFSAIAAFGYVMQAAGSTTNLNVSRIRGRDCRHVFTTIADERAGGVFWGGPMFVQVNDGIGFGSTDSKSVFDTHEFGRHIHFNNCMAIGGGIGTSGFQVRAQEVQLNNCRAYRCGLHGVVARKDSKNVQILGGEFAYCGGNGINLLGERGHVVGARIHDNVSSGVTVAVTTAVDNRISDCAIWGNLYGILDGNLSTRTTIRNCDIPWSAAQTVAIVQPSATAVIVGNVHSGYGAGQHGITTITAGCRIANLVADSYVTNNMGINPGSIGGTSLTFTEVLYRGASGQVRTDAVMRALSFSVNGGPTITSGTGTPEGSVTAPVGSIRFRTDGGAGTSVYIKESGTGNTGWVAK